MYRRTFLVNGRGIDVDSVDFTDTAGVENESYYEVTAPNIKEVLLFSGPPGSQLRVLEHAISKWYDMGKLDEGILTFPTDRIVEI